MEAGITWRVRETLQLLDAKVMGDEFLTLRQEVYNCASRFHTAMANYFDALKGEASAGSVEDAKLAVREAGARYNAALVASMKHLRALPGNAEINKEAEWIERTISLLTFEMRRV